jgi:predicted Zn-dependent peptidase
MAMHHTLETVRLSNGSEGLIINTPGATVAAYAIQFRAGSDKKTRAFPFQVAHTLEHVVEAGPDEPQFSKKSEYLQEIRKNGAWRNAYTGQFGISYVGDCTPDELLRILKLRISSIVKPKFNESILKSESGNVLEELRQRVTDYTRLSNALSRKVLTNGAWQTSKEAMDEVESVSLDDVVNYYEKTHTTNNLRFIIACDVGNLKDSILDLFGSISLPAGDRMTGPTHRSNEAVGYYYEKRLSLENLFTNFSISIPRQLDPKEVMTMQIIINLLCNSWDSRILGKARDAGLCYSMSGYIEESKTQTVLSFDTPIGPMNARKFFKLLSAGLKDLSEGNITTIELKNAKTFLNGQSKKKGQTTQELLDMYSEEYFSLDRVTNAKDRTDFIDSVSSEDISVLMNEFVVSDSKVFSGVGCIDENEFKQVYEDFTSDF